MKNDSLTQQQSCEIGVCKKEKKKKHSKKKREKVRKNEDTKMRMERWQSIITFVGRQNTWHILIMITILRQIILLFSNWEAKNKRMKEIKSCWGTWGNLYDNRKFNWLTLSLPQSCWLCHCQRCNCFCFKRIVT